MIATVVVARHRWVGVGFVGWWAVAAGSGTAVGLRRGC